VGTWVINLDYQKEFLEKVLHEVVLHHEWFVEHQIDSGDYLRMMTNYEILSLEVESKKTMPLFHEKMK
jgi:hypothetical protein